VQFAQQRQKENPMQRLTEKISQAYERRRVCKPDHVESMGYSMQDAYSGASHPSGTTSFFPRIENDAATTKYCENSHQLKLKAYKAKNDQLERRKYTLQF